MSKKFISLILTLAMVLTLGLGLVSCADDNGNAGGGNADGGNTGSAGDGKDTYTVTVKDTEGNPVANVEFAMVKVKGGTEIPYPDTQKSDTDGRTEFKVKPDTWKVKVDKVPAGFVLPTATYDFTDKAVTITLSLLPLYTIKVVDQNGDAVVGAYVQMCIGGEGGVCVAFRQPTDENGEATMRIKFDNYEANFTGDLPDGYTYDGGYVAFSGDEIGGFNVTLEVTKN